MSENRHYKAAIRESELALSSVSDLRIRPEVLNSSRACSGLSVESRFQPCVEQPLALLIEPSAYARESARTCLQSLGYRVIAFGRAQDALELQQGLQSPLACIALDLNIRDLEIVETLRRIRRQSPRTPLVLARSADQHSACQQAESDPWTSYVSKPYSADEIRSSIRRILLREAVA